MHTYPMSISCLLYVSLVIHYQSYGTTGKYSCNTTHTHSMGVMSYLNQYQLPLHKIIIMYTSLDTLLATQFTFSTETLGHVIFPHKPRDQVIMGPEKELIHLMSVISTLTNDHRQIPSSPSKTGLVGLTTTRISKNQSHYFQQNLNLLVPNPLFPMQRHLGLS